MNVVRLCKYRRPGKLCQATGCICGKGRCNRKSMLLSHKLILPLCCISLWTTYSLFCEYHLRKFFISTSYVMVTSTNLTQFLMNLALVCWWYTPTAGQQVLLWSSESLTYRMSIKQRNTYVVAYCSEGLKGIRSHHNHTIKVSQLHFSFPLGRLIFPNFHALFSYKNHMVTPCSSGPVTGIARSWAVFSFHSFIVLYWSMNRPPRLWSLVEL